MNSKQVNMIMKVLMDNSSDNPFKDTISKVNKIGNYRLKGAEHNDILGYTNLLIVEYLNTVSIDYWNSLDNMQREKDILLYCNNEFKKMSRNESINNNFLYDNTNNSYSRIYNLDIDSIDITDNSEIITTDNSSTSLTKYIFDTYINESYLTRFQLKYINTVKNNYIDEQGNVKDMNTNEILYTKQASYKHKKCIFNRLNHLIENDALITVNSHNRWVFK